jgi:hypothetical protein
VHSPAASLHPGLRLLVSVLLFVPIWYGFNYANALTFVSAMIWLVVAPFVLRDLWFEVNDHDALTVAVEPQGSGSAHR